VLVVLSKLNAFFLKRYQQNACAHANATESPGVWQQQRADVLNEEQNLQVAG
jgi:hypothetical protein